MKISDEKQNTDDKQRQRHPQRDQIKKIEAVHVANIQYLGAFVSEDGLRLKVLSRTAQATTALIKLKPIWRNNLSLETKQIMVRSVIISVFQYACESWL